VQPSERIKAIKNPKGKNALAAHERLDAVYTYFDTVIPERVQLASTIAGSMLSSGKFTKDEATAIALQTADKLLE